MSQTIRRIICFAAAVLLLQSLALLFLTPGGIELLYPIQVRLSAEKVRTDGNTYAVYYDMRQSAAEADVIVVGIDPGVGASYDMLGHFTRFIKQYNNLSCVALDLNDMQTTLVTFLFMQSEEERYYTFLSRLSEGTGMSEDCCGYLSELFFVNSTMSPEKKFTVRSYNEKSGSDGFGESETTEDTRTLAGKICDTVNKSERGVLCAVDCRELEYGSDFRNELSLLMPEKKIVYVQTCYTKGCPSPETHTSVSFPFEPDGASVYFVNNSDLERFYSYYAAVVGLFGSNRSLPDRLDERYTDFYFIVAGGRDDASENEAESGGTGGSEVRESDAEESEESAEDYGNYGEI